MRWGFQRQDQPFQEWTGPPCTHSSSGNGPSPSGSTSQDRSGLPSSAVAVTSSSRPGGAGAVGRSLQEHRRLVGALDRSSRTGAGALSTASRRAYAVPAVG